MRVFECICACIILRLTVKWLYETKNDSRYFIGRGFNYSFSKYASDDAPSFFLENKHVAHYLDASYFYFRILFWVSD